MVLVKSSVGEPWGLDSLFPLPLAGATGVLGYWVAFCLRRERGVDLLTVWWVLLWY